MGKPTVCIGENKGTEQLRSYCEADQHCFSLLSKSKISSLYLSSVTVQPGLCRTWLENELLVFSCTGSTTIPSKTFFAREGQNFNFVLWQLRDSYYS